MEHRDTTAHHNTADRDASAARRTRFGALPERVRFEDMVEERPAAPRDPARDNYDPEGSWRSFSCLAADLAP
ncbi:hypothetical protein [Streptomyces niger]|uniref:hypothetical protein n=1 Tax=Streptomyces niger TaxID=66373 RepID=UPI00069A4C88|nr:hypothetical protein [Streptomyces niger]